MSCALPCDQKTTRIYLIPMSLKGLDVRLFYTAWIVCHHKFYNVVHINYKYPHATKEEEQERWGGIVKKINGKCRNTKNRNRKNLWTRRLIVTVYSFWSRLQLSDVILKLMCTGCLWISLKLAAMHIQFVFNHILTQLDVQCVVK